MEFLEFALSTLRTLTVVASYFYINFISKYLECDYFVKRKIFTLKRKSGPFFLTALHKLIFPLKMVTRN